MVWIIRGGLALISAILVIAIILAPDHFLVWLQGFAIVGVLGLYAEGERLHRVGRSIFPGHSKRRAAVAILGFGVLCALMTINSFLKEFYFTAAFNAAGVLISLLLAYILISMPNRTIEADARKNDARRSTIACWGCGVAGERLVLGPPGLAVCHDCILAGDVAADIEFQGPCSFCEKRVGASLGWFRRGKRRACLVHGASAICQECLGLMRDIVGERLREQSAT